MDKAALQRHLRRMGDIVNLRMARKAKARADASAKAGQNRARFGHTKAEKAVGALEAKRAAKLLDQAKREPD